MTRTQDKFSWVYAAVTLAIVVLVLSSTWVEHRIREQLQSDIKQALEAVVEAERWGVHSWYEQQRMLAAVLAENPQLSALIQAKKSGTPAASLEKDLQDWFFNVSHEAFLDYALLDATGTVLHRPSERSQIHPLRSELKLLQTALKTAQVKFSPAVLEKTPLGKHYQLYLLAPVHNPHSKNPEALLALRLNPLKLFPSLMRIPFLGKTGETYIIDANGLMLTPSRFDPELQKMELLPKGQSSALHLAVRNPGSPKFPLTPMAAELVKGHSGASISPYRDYRGVSVVGAWRWDEQLGIGIATEQDASEALRGIYNAEWVLYGFTFFLVLLILGLAQAFRWRIQRLEAINAKLLGHALSFFKVFDSAEDAIFILEGSAIAACNAAAQRLFKTTEDLSQQNWTDFSPSHQPNGRSSSLHLAEMVEQVQGGEALRFDWRFLTPEGQQFSADVRFNRMGVGSYVQAIVRERYQDLWSET